MACMVAIHALPFPLREKKLPLPPRPSRGWNPDPKLSDELTDSPLGMASWRTASRARFTCRTSRRREIRGMPTNVLTFLVAMATCWCAVAGVPQNESAFCFLQEYLQDDCQGPMTRSDTAVTGMCVWKNDTQVPTYAGVTLLSRTEVNWTYFRYPNCTGLESSETYPVASCMTEGFDCTDGEDNADEPCSRLVTCYFATTGNGDNAGGGLMHTFLASVLFLTGWHALWQTHFTWSGQP